MLCTTIVTGWLCYALLLFQAGYAMHYHCNRLAMLCTTIVTGWLYYALPL